MKKENTKQCGCTAKIVVPEGKFCSDCPYYKDKGPTCLKLGDQVPFHLSKHCINYGGYKYTDCPIYKS